MKRILQALGAFALSISLFGTLTAPAWAAEPTAKPEEASYAGYLVSVDPTATVAAVVTGEEAQLSWTDMAAYKEMEELLPISEELGIYKAGDLSEIRSMVYAGLVSQVEPDYEAELFDITSTDFLVSTTPNDEYISYQYNLNNTAGISVRSGWEAGLTGAGVTVAVIDSGLNYSHVDVPVKIARGRAFYYKEAVNGLYSLTVNGVTKKYNYYGNSNISALGDEMGHGSMVSGIIASPANNRTNIAGIAPGVTLIPIKCFTKEEGKLGGYVSNLISGINFAVENGADIINMSWGIRSRSTALEQAITAASNAGCILVAAAGNDGSSTVQYPAGYSNVISVGATDQTGDLATYSQRNSTIDLCAPGTNIYSISATNATLSARGSGTSFASPTVAAVIALLKESSPTLTQGDFLSLIQGSCDQVGEDNAYAGAGRLNLKKLLDKMGHAGVIRQVGSNSVAVQANFHPKEGVEVPSEGVMVLLCGYNGTGHLLQSTISVANKDSYGSYRVAAAFDDSNITTFRAFFLKADGSLAALCEGQECSVVGQ